MDVDTFTFLLDAAFHFVYAVTSAIEFIIYFNNGFGATGDFFGLAFCIVVFIFHALQLRFFQHHITVQQLNAAPPQ